MCFKCTTWWLNICIYCKMITLSLVNIHHHMQLTVFFLVMRTCKIYCLSILRIYNTVLLSIVAMLYITSPWFIYFITGVCTFWPHCSSCPSFGSHQSSLCIYELEIFGGPRNGFLISEIIEYLSFSVLPISFSTMPSGFVFHVVADDRISFFLCLNGVPVCVWGVLYPVTLPWILRLFPCLGHCKYAAMNMVWRSIDLFWVSLSTLKFPRNESTFSNHLYFHSYVTAFEYKIK